MPKIREQKELEQKKLEQKKVIEKAFNEKGFSVAEVNEIIQAKKNGKSFPLSDNKWYALPALYRGYYWDYVNWVKSGRQNVEPTIPQMFENESVTPPSPSSSEDSLKDWELLEFESLEAACKAAAEEETKVDKAAEKTRPVSVVAPLPTHFSKIPQLKRSDSVLSTDSNASLTSNSSKLSNSSKINARSLIDNQNGVNNYIQNYYPISNKREFLPTEPNKNQPAKVNSSAPTTPIIRKKNINFVELNKVNVGNFFKRNNVSKDDATSTPSFTKQ